MQLVLSQDELTKVIRLCLSYPNIVRMSRYQIQFDYSAKEYSDIYNTMVHPEEVDVYIEMLKADKRLIFIDQGFTNAEYDLTLENAKNRLKGAEAIAGVSAILSGKYTDNDLFMVLQYMLYGRYKYPAL